MRLSDRKTTQALVHPEARVLDFRFGFDAHGAVSHVQEYDRVEALILQVLLTSPGERWSEPEFGCGLLDLVFEPLHTVTLATLRYRIKRSVNRWLGDLVRVREADAVESEVQGMSCIEVSISYSLVAQPDVAKRLALRLRREE